MSSSTPEHADDEALPEGDVERRDQDGDDSLTPVDDVATVDDVDDRRCDSSADLEPVAEMESDEDAVVSDAGSHFSSCA